MHYQSIDACRTVFNECLQGNGQKQERIMSLAKALEEAHLSKLSADKDSVLCLITANLSVIIMHLSKYCPTYPPTGKRWGFDLILTAKHSPDQVDLINIYKITGQKCTVLRGAFDPSICSREEGN